jgi:TonB family protein
MWIRMLTAVILASSSSAVADPSDFENPKFFSENGELCLVVRNDPRIADFERLTSDAYWQRRAIEDWLDAYPLADAGDNAPRETAGAALYRRWPGGFQQPLSEFSFRAGEPRDRILIASDGHIVTYAPVTHGRDAELLTIRSSDGSIVRTLVARDVFTANDQQWLYRGSENDVRLSVRDDAGTSTLLLTFLVTDGSWDDKDARHHTVEIDLATGATPAPDHDLCPPPLRVVAEADDGSAAHKTFVSVGDDDAFDSDAVVSIQSEALLQRAVRRVLPEYPDVAQKARISGRVRVDIVVGLDGRVVAARIHPLPFIEQTVKAAIMEWQFEPYVSGDGARPFSGSLVFRFEIVRSYKLTVTTTTSCGGTRAKR